MIGAGGGIMTGAGGGGGGTTNVAGGGGGGILASISLSFRSSIRSSTISPAAERAAMTSWSTMDLVSKN
jgi:hypothetical protein